MNIEEAWTSIKATLYERTASPLLSTFFLSWAAVNYKFFLILLASAEIEVKLALLDAIVFPPGNQKYLHLLALPILSTVVVLYFLPFFSRPVYAWWMDQQQKLLDIKHNKDGQRRLTIEESRKLLLSIRNIEKGHDDETSLLNARIEALTTELDRREIRPTPIEDKNLDRKTPDSPTSLKGNKDNSKAEETTSFNFPSPQSIYSRQDLSPRFSKEQIAYFREQMPTAGQERQIVEILDAANGGYEQELFRSFNYDQLIHTIDKLSDKKFLRTDGSPPNRMVTLTDHGRRAAEILPVIKEYEIKNGLA